MKVLPSTTPDAHLVKCELATEVLRSSGKLRLQVTGWSMLPTVWPGDILLIERTNYSAVAQEDIVLVGRDRSLCVHRVIRCLGGPTGRSIITRGDAMVADDPPVAEEELLGKIHSIVRDGKCFEPRKSMRILERAVAASVRSSVTAARIVVRMRELLHSRSIQTA